MCFSAAACLCFLCSSSQTRCITFQPPACFFSPWLYMGSPVRKCHIGERSVAVSPPSAWWGKLNNFAFSRCCFTFHQPLWCFTCAKPITPGSLVCMYVCVYKCVSVFVVVFFLFFFVLCSSKPHLRLHPCIFCQSIFPSCSLIKLLPPPTQHTHAHTQRHALSLSHTHTHTIALLSLSLSFFFLRASRSPCPWLYDREKCVYKTRSLADQTIRPNQRLWRERQRRSEGRDRERKIDREKGYEQRVCRGLIILKFSVCLFSFFLFMCLCLCVCVCVYVSACISFGNTISLRPPKQLSVSHS